MTFTEAAAHVLRLVGKPLHYKEITDVAIEKNLLSHVGKSPDVTMGARLAAIAQKDEKDCDLVRIKPGVFALRDWDDETVKKGLEDRTPALEKIRLAEANGVIVTPPETAARPAADDDDDEVLVGAEDTTDEEDPVDVLEAERTARLADASDVFEAEEDDDDPIFGGEGEEAERPGDREGGRRRRRRRRRGRGAADNGGMPSYTVADAPADNRGAERGGERGGERGAERGGERGAERGGERGAERSERPERGDRRDRHAERVDARPEDARPADEDDAGGDLADAVARLLGRRGGTIPTRQLAEMAQRQWRWPGDLQALQATLTAAARADVARSQAQGLRPRFRIVGGRIGATDAAMDQQLLDLEQQLLAVAERYREGSRRALLRRLQDLPTRAFAELVLVVLESQGLQSFRVSRRNGGQGADIGFSATGTGDVPTAVLIRRDGRDIGREQVTELRGSLHHYRGAVAACMVTTGQVLSGAREEAAAPGGAPTTLIDGASLARLCETHGVGVVETRLTLAVPDLEFFESIRAG